ncbi:MAG: cation:proton antiporter, partial [Anaerolineales bacterium]
MNTEVLLNLQELGILVLIIAIVVAVVARRLRLPYTIGLVLIGVGMSFLNLSDFHITPELILFVLVPPLLYEAAYHLQLEDLRKNIVPILTWAIPGVIITTLLVGWGIARTISISVPAAIVFGSLMA